MPAKRRPVSLWIKVPLVLFALFVGACAATGGYAWYAISKFEAETEAQFNKFSAEYAACAHEAIEAWPDEGKFRDAFRRSDELWAKMCAFTDLFPKFTEKRRRFGRVGIELVSVNSYLSYLQKSTEDLAKEVERSDREVASILPKKEGAFPELADVLQRQIDSAQSLAKELQEQFDDHAREAQDDINRAAVRLAEVERVKWW